MTGRRVLIVGAGMIGRRHAKAVLRSGDAVCAVVDANPERGRAFAAEFGGQAVASLDELDALDALDADGGLPVADTAVIATPSPAHHAQSVRLLARGLDVLVEKPHRVPGQPAAELARAVAAGGGRYAIGMTTRHWPGVRALAAAVREGTLGRVLAYDDRMHFLLGPDDLPPWYFDPERSGGGILLTNGVHALDRARAVLGSALAVDRARLVTVFPDHGCEDSAELDLHGGDGTPVHISLLWSPVTPLGAGLQVTGTAGVARVEMDGSWRIVTAASEFHGPAIDDDEPFARQWEAFRAGEPGFALDDLEPTLELIEAVYREARS